MRPLWAAFTSACVAALLACAAHAQNVWDGGNVHRVVSPDVAAPPLSGDTTDTDGDGMSDVWEKRYSEVTDPGATPLDWQVDDALLDNDGDGVANLDEYRWMTDPTDPADYFQLVDVARTAGNEIEITWHSVSGQPHTVYRSTSPDPAGSWTSVYGPVGGTGANMSYSEPIGASTHAYFRVAVVPRQPDYWPNEVSATNSDDWIHDNHDRIHVMRPKVLVLVFMNDWHQEVTLTNQFINALKISTKYHGYADPTAPAFLQYQVAKYVDLRDPPGTPTLDGNSTKFPRLSTSGMNFRYTDLYNDTFAGYYGYPDPDHPGEYLDLNELIQRGIVNELWFFAYHGAYGAPYETIELKQYYDANLNKRVGVHGPAGNGHYNIPWSGGSFRITFINGQRGIGCATENLGHALEGMANYNFCPYYRTYFYEYAGFDLDTRWGLPFNSFYYYRYDGSDYNNYMKPDRLVAHYYGTDYTVNNYYVIGGNVHWMPTGRTQYDLDNTQSVYSTIEHYRLFDGPDGQDQKELWNRSKFVPYYSVAPDCMGPWLVYWRMNMPGLDNPCLDNAGQPMKNWWVFLFY
jgi:hypothetical protein